MILSKIINSVIAIFVFVICRKETRQILNDMHNKKIGYPVYKNNFDFGQVFMLGILVVLLLFIIYESSLRLLKSKSTTIIALCTGGIPFLAIVIFFTIYSRNQDLGSLVLGASPLLVTGLIIPFSEKWINWLLKGFTGSGRVTSH